VRRIYVPPDRIEGSAARLLAPDRHYLRDVLRLPAGAAVEVFDGEGGAYDATIEANGIVRLGARRDAPPPRGRVHLAFALARGEKADLVVQKATELGVSRLSPFEAARSVVRLEPARAAGRVARWRKIAAEAARQCGRADVPEVDAPAPLAAVLAAAGAGVQKLVLYEGVGEPFGSAVDRGAAGHLAAVGPEGGFTPDEVEVALRAGARLVTLGPRILRFETAAIAAAALLQHLAGDLGGPDL
jgi:16S rRNA (uracil1498-N3)-methyltransferase